MYKILKNMLIKCQYIYKKYIEINQSLIVFVLVIVLPYI